MDPDPGDEEAPNRLRETESSRWTARFLLLQL